MHPPWGVAVCDVIIALFARLGNAIAQMCNEPGGRGAGRAFLQGVGPLDRRWVPHYLLRGWATPGTIEQL